VNLASRLVNIARPASVVTSPEVHDLLEGAEGLAWRSMRQRWLKGIGRVHPWVLRRGEQ
jgi:class 3 adenylate cyclase